MFEVIICTVNTGRVLHKLFDDREQADEYIDNFFTPRGIRPRQRRNYRVEVNCRPQPAAKPAVTGAAA